MVRLRNVILPAALLLAPAFAFGTIEGLGQNSEHEGITRAALANAGLERDTMDMLAGRRGSFGAVGAPDRPDRGLLTESAAHCDNADYFAPAAGAPPYAQSEAEAAARLAACRVFMNAALSAAVEHAGRIVPEGGNAVADSEIPTRIACLFTGTPGRAKCDVLEQLGMAMHVAQDFYAHTNWTDAQVQTPSPENPPGLGRQGPAPWFAPFASGAAFPAGLISGCFEGMPESLHCSDRVRHAALNKDTGPIDEVTGAAGEGTTPRGAADGNFARAVAAAIGQTRLLWQAFEAQLARRYGEPRATIILCAIRKDDPDDCRADH